MKARDIMTTALHTAKRQTSVGEIAKLMTENRVSGVPIVTDDNQVIGIVSETDLLHRRENGTEKRRKWWLDMLKDADELAREYAKSHGLRADDVMTRYVVTVGEDTSLRDIADILDRNNLKRVPVVRDGTLVGIITRGDLVRRLASVDEGGTADPADDAGVQKALIEAIDRQPWLEPAFISATVDSGTVELWGFIGSEDQRKALRVLVAEVAGGREIKDKLTLGRRYMSSAA